MIKDIESEALRVADEHPLIVTTEVQATAVYFTLHLSRYEMLMATIREGLPITVERHLQTRMMKVYDKCGIWTTADLVKVFPSWACQDYLGDYLTIPTRRAYDAWLSVLARYLDGAHPLKEGDA